MNQHLLQLRRSTENLQQKILQNLLKISTKGPNQLEEIFAAAKTRLINYENEGDEEGASLYRPIVQILEKIETLEEFDKYVVNRRG